MISCAHMSSPGTAIWLFFKIAGLEERGGDGDSIE